MEEATKFRDREKKKEKQRELDEKKLFGDDTVDVEAQQPEAVTNGNNRDVADKAKDQITAAKTNDVTMEESIQEEIVEDTQWDWTDSNQVGEFMQFSHCH